MKVRFGPFPSAFVLVVLPVLNNILIVSDNIYIYIYIAIQKMKVYFVDLFCVQNSLSFAIGVACDLSNTTIKNLIANEVVIFLIIFEMVDR